MNKERLKGVVVGFILCTLISSSVMVVANAQTVTRQITYGVGVILNGEAVRFNDDSRPFVMDGRTFLPIRALAELLDLPVDFDPNTNNAILGRTQTSLGTSITDLFFDGGAQYRNTNAFSVGVTGNTSVRSATMGGVEYSDAIFYYAASQSGNRLPQVRNWSLHNLDGQYNWFRGRIGRVDGSSSHDATVNIYADGQLLQTVEVSAHGLPTELSLYVEGVRLLQFEVERDVQLDGQVNYALVGYLE